MLESIQEVMKERGYSFAYGLAVFHPGDDVDLVNKEADEKMYKMKKHMKQNIYTKYNI